MGPRICGKKDIGEANNLGRMAMVDLLSHEKAVGEMGEDGKAQMGPHLRVLDRTGFGKWWDAPNSLPHPRITQMGVRNVLLTISGRNLSDEPVYSGFTL